MAVTICGPYACSAAIVVKAAIIGSEFVDTLIAKGNGQSGRIRQVFSSIGDAIRPARPDMPDKEMPMSTKSVALVTGANKGIGLAIARQLGERGFAVWIGCRDEKRGESAAAGLRDAGVDARAIVLDVADSASVRAAAARLEAEVAALDVLVNNAGISLGTPARVSEEPVGDIRTMFEVNALGPVRVTQAFLPLLRKSGAARVVMMSSGLGSIGATLDTASESWGVGYAGYSASKSALNMFTAKLAKELLPEGIKVNAADPGLTATDLNGHMGNRSVDEGARIAVDLAMLGVMGPTGGFFHDGVADHMPRHRW